MNKKYALIFAYVYNETDYSSLEASKTDLYTVYEYLNEKGIYCFIFDDFSNQTFTYKRARDLRFLSFHSANSDTGYIKLGTKNPFEDNTLKTCLTSADGIFVYFSGHMTSCGKLCFPFGEMQLDKFLIDLGTFVPEYADVFFVNDSCYSGCARFPYKLENTEIIPSHIEGEFITVTQHVFYMHSSLENEVARSSKLRSHFTKYLLKYLKEMIVVTSNLLHQIQAKLDQRSAKHLAQTCGVKYSKRTGLLIWPWIFGIPATITRDGLLLL